MPTRKLTPGSLPKRVRPRTAAASWQTGVGSWTSFLAATTLGVTGASTVRAEVIAADAELTEGRDYRLVVQSYDGPASGSRSAGRSRPVASTQRSVTAAELRRGVRVDLLELRHAATEPVCTSRTSDDAARGSLAKNLVIAWVEEGKPDLEYDARRARPLPGSFVGEAAREASQDSVHISVKAGVST